MIGVRVRLTTVTPSEITYHEGHSFTWDHGEGIVRIDDVNEEMIAAVSISAVLSVEELPQSVEVVVTR